MAQIRRRSRSNLHSRPGIKPVLTTASMPTVSKKRKNRWLDVEIVIGSLGMVFTLGLWNVFASGATNSTSQPLTGSQDTINTNVQAIQVPTQAPTQAPQSLGSILFGSAPSQSSSQPVPVTITSSSRP